ncbi:hypothetical protein HDU91_004899 [Kappamyces sp. JEL0680]|nr:hypothetical protein HDU91_004899 [Kappamyces sp. JEL0680]
MARIYSVFNKTEHAATATTARSNHSAPFDTPSVRPSPTKTRNGAGLNQTLTTPYGQLQNEPISKSTRAPQRSSGEPAVLARASSSLDAMAKDKEVICILSSSDTEDEPKARRPTAILESSPSVNPGTPKSIQTWSQARGGGRYAIQASVATIGKISEGSNGAYHSVVLRDAAGDTLESTMPARLIAEGIGMPFEDFQVLKTTEPAIAREIVVAYFKRIKTLTGLFAIDFGKSGKSVHFAQPFEISSPSSPHSSQDMNGIPSSSPAATSIPHRSPGASEVLRSKNKKRDDAIRKKVEQELGRRTTRKGPSNAEAAAGSRRKGTVSSLRPNPAITILETAKIIQAAQLMAAKRSDAVLVLDEKGDLRGILTDKDIAFRVVAEGLDVRTTAVSAVMTAEPIYVFDQGSRNEALNIMISRKFRHLPVLREDDDYDSEYTSASNVVGLLDITKCVFERLDDLERKVYEDQSIINAMEVLERRGNMNADKIDTMRTEHECPNIGSVLEKNGKHVGDFPSIGIKASVREAARVMKQFHGTAVLVTGTPDGADRVGGILTTKDIVLRVLAASLDPNTTSVVRVMVSSARFTQTPHPDFVSSSASILDALKKLHIGHFLHLPVIDDGLPVGLVDVMTLTITMLTYLMNRSGVTTDLTEEGPMWNHFWNNTFPGPAPVENDRLSQTSESRTGLASSFIQSSRHRAISPEPSIRESVLSRQLFVAESPFSFKLKDVLPQGSGKIFRFSSPGNSLLALYEAVCSKTGYSSNLSNSPQDLDILVPSGEAARLFYTDEDGDGVALESDKDLQEAVQMAFSEHKSRLVIYVGDPTKHAAALLADRSRASSVSIASGPQSVAPAPVLVQQTEPSLFETLKEAPLAVNVAISAAIVVASYWVIRRIG